MTTEIAPLFPCQAVPLLPVLVADRYHRLLSRRASVSMTSILQPFNFHERRAQRIAAAASRDLAVVPESETGIPADDDGSAIEVQQPDALHQPTAVAAVPLISSHQLTNGDMAQPQPLHPIDCRFRLTMDACIDEQDGNTVAPIKATSNGAIARHHEDEEIMHGAAASPTIGASVFAGHRFSRHVRDQEFVLDDADPVSLTTAGRYPLPAANGDLVYPAAAASPAAASSTTSRRSPSLSASSASFSESSISSDGEITVSAIDPSDWRVRFQQDLALSEQLGSDFAQLNDIHAPDDNGIPRAPPLEPLQHQFGSFRHAGDDRRRRSLSLIPQSKLQRGNRGGLPPLPVVHASVTCGICLEQVPEPSTRVFGRQMFRNEHNQVLQVQSRAKEASCTHRFCAECLTAYLTHQIENGEVLRLRCPGRSEEDGSPCACVAPSLWLREQVGRETFGKFERFLQLRQDQTFRSCPKCMHVQKRGARRPAAERLSAEAAGDRDTVSNSMECEQCQTVYCYLHDLAHAGSSCSAYAARLASESAASLAHIASNTVRCPWPTCRVQVIKSMGCNHMTCSRCNAEFCYLCGGFYLGGLHFAGINLLGCPGMKSDDGAANSRNSWPRFIARWLFGLPLLLLGIGLFLSVLLAGEAVYLAWLVCLSPVWIAWALVLSVARRRTPGHSFFYHHPMYRWQERLKSCITWGGSYAGALCSMLG